MDFKIGDLVKVGPAYRMMSGTPEHDAWTGKTMRIGEIDGRDAGLMNGSVNMTGLGDWEDLIEVYITLGRLTKI